MTQVVKLRLEPSPAQVELLRGYCGTALGAYNTLLFQFRANLGQRAAEKTYDVTGADLTPALSWHRFGLNPPRVAVLVTAGRPWAGRNVAVPIPTTPALPDPGQSGTPSATPSNGQAGAANHRR